ncbi:MAG: YggT family protein [Alphaproteobacteria bacterium]|nr:YggT family protein [Alphaproteobacteria bacterium]
MYVIGHPLLALTSILGDLLFIYMILIIAAAIVSWVNPDPLNPIVRFLRMVTDPAMDKIRPYIPSIGGLDLTPIALLIVISFVQRGILPVIKTFAQGLIQ